MGMGASMYSLSQTGCPRGLTNVVAVTRDHANQRACKHHCVIGLCPRSVPIVATHHVSSGRLPARVGRLITCQTATCQLWHDRNIRGPRSNLAQLVYTLHSNTCFCPTCRSPPFLAVRIRLRILSLLLVESAPLLVAKVFPATESPQASPLAGATQAGAATATSDPSDALSGPHRCP